jgi:hypothetical protein
VLEVRYAVSTHGSLSPRYVACQLPCLIVCLLAPALHAQQVRHSTDSGKLQWQNRPLTNELITCAAADVAYLVPLMETQVRQQLQ